MTQSTKSALLLGAGSDMAVAIGRQLASRGYDLVLAGRDKDYLGGLATDLSIRGAVQVTVQYFDALDYGSHEAFYASLPHVPEVTVCAFGYLGDQEKGLTDWKETQRILGTNYIGAVSILNIIASDYARLKKGIIVGISSVAGDRGRGSNFLYGSAKAGFSAYLSGLRNRFFKEGVSVITVKPGFAATRMTAHLHLPPALTASPEQVGNSVIKAISNKKDTIYVKSVWKYLMLAIRMIPEPFFKKMSL
jgi:decaprenylphospho-beta-D-erythro-pentofuranosid-2-ulose 2-reductase